MDSAVCGQFTVQWVCGQCSAGMDCLSGAAFRSKPVSSREAAQARWVQQASSQSLGERVVGHLVTATTRAGTNYQRALTMALQNTMTRQNRDIFLAD